MATPAKYVQTNTLYLAGSGVIVGATTVIVTSFTDIYGNVLTMTDFGTKGYGTLEPDTTNEEAFTFTGVVANANGTYSLTGVNTALAKSPYTETAGLVRAHAGGTKAVITDNVAFWNGFANKANDETITGTWIFNIAPSSLSATRATTAALGNVKLSAAAAKSLGTATITIASPGVVSNTAHGLIAGDSVQFTTTGALPTGLVVLTDYYVIATGLTANAFQLSATVAGAAINTSGVQSGVHTLFRSTPVTIVDNDNRLPQNAYGVDAVGTDSYAITLTTAPTAYTAGQMFLFKAQVANTGAATLNVNALGAQTIKNTNGNDLSDNDIVAGQVVLVIYDGTNMRIIGRQSQSKFGGTGADGALSISSGTTTLSFASAQYLIKNYTSIAISGTAVLGFSNPHTNGSVMLLKSQGNVTITSSTVPAVDLRLMGAAGGSHAGTTKGNNGTSTGAAPRGGDRAPTSTTFTSVADIIQLATSGLGIYAASVPGKAPVVFAGSGGGSGSNHANTGGDGGIGGGGLYIECAGSLNITSTFNVTGQVGGTGSGAGGGGVVGSGGKGGGGYFDSTTPASSLTAAADGGGGGAGGSVVIIYSVLTANTATFTVTGGAAGTPAAGGNAGTAGGDGYSVVLLNTELT